MYAIILICHFNMRAQGFPRSVASSSHSIWRWVCEVDGCVRQICTNLKLPLIFDEIAAGFRICPGGAQEMFGVTPVPPNSPHFHLTYLW
eukprot:SAG11_NODE_2521_length_3261_cov_1.530993_5_plen_89_part_00